MSCFEVGQKIIVCPIDHIEGFLRLLEHDFCNIHMSQEQLHLSHSVFQNGMDGGISGKALKTEVEKQIVGDMFQTVVGDSCESLCLRNDNQSLANNQIHNAN